MKRYRLISLLFLMVALLNLCVVTVSASNISGFDRVSSSGYATTYTLAPSGQTIPYTNKNLNQRGTASYGASNNSYIDNSSDDLRVMDVGYWNPFGLWQKKAS